MRKKEVNAQLDEQLMLERTVRRTAYARAFSQTNSFTIQWRWLVTLSDGAPHVPSHPSAGGAGVGVGRRQNSVCDYFFPVYVFVRDREVVNNQVIVQCKWRPLLMLLLWLFYGASWVLVLSHRIAPVCVGVGVSVTCLYQNWCFYYLTLSHIVVFYLFALISTFDRVSVSTSKTATLLPLSVCHCLQHWAAPTVSGSKLFTAPCHRH